MSIFSINDNSNYGSILSQAKANKESKENSKIAQDGWLDAGIYAMEKGVKWQNVYVGSGISFDREFHQAKANGWKASNESINSFVNNIMDRFNNLIGQTRV